MPAPDVTVLIATCNDRLSRIKLPGEHPRVKYLIVHQQDAACYEEILDVSGLKKREDVEVLSIRGMGLSKNRNFGLSHCKTKYAFIMDDDVFTDVGKALEVIDLMRNGLCDIATFQHVYESGLWPRKYAQESFSHDLLSLAKVSSIDIAVDVESVRKKGVLFDEEFGLGTSLPSGEEYIFLSQCLKEGLDVVYVPILVNIHPDVVSGQDFFSSRERILSKRMMLKKVFGNKAMIFIAAFWLKKFPVALLRGYGYLFTKVLFLGRSG